MMQLRCPLKRHASPGLFGRHGAIPFLSDADLAGRAQPLLCVAGACYALSLPSQRHTC